MNNAIDKYDAFFFDFDGVLVDSVDIKTSAFADLYLPFGEEVVARVKAHHQAHGGVSRYEKIHHYHRHYLNEDLTDQELEQWARKFSDLVVDKVVAAPFIPGAIEFLSILQNRQKKIFLISATPEAEIRRIVKKKDMMHFFREIKGAPRKKQENLIDILRHYRLSAQKCSYFGDSDQDREAAESVHMDFIPINYCDSRTGYRDFRALMPVWGLSVNTDRPSKVRS